MQYSRKHLVIIRDLMLEDIPDDDVVKRLPKEEFPDTTRNSITGLWNRGRVSLVCDAEQKRMLEGFRAARTSGSGHYVATATKTARKKTGVSFGHALAPGKRPKAPLEEGSAEDLAWDASKLQAKLEAKKPVMNPEPEPCQYPGCNSCSVPRLFGGWFKIPERIRSLGSPVRSNCITHAYRSLAKAGKKNMRDAFEESGILVS